MLTVEIRQGRGGRYRWFAVRGGKVRYSCFPRSFSDAQLAWEDAEWAIGAPVTMVYDDPDEGFEQYAGEREFN